MAEGPVTGQGLRIDYESAGIGEEDLRQMQGHSAAWRRPRDLHEREAQAAAGLTRLRP
jgi:hypothetical protein